MQRWHHCMPRSRSLNANLNHCGVFCGFSFLMYFIANIINMLNPDFCSSLPLLAIVLHFRLMHAVTAPVYTKSMFTKNVVFTILVYLTLLWPLCRWARPAGGQSQTTGSGSGCRTIPPQAERGHRQPLQPRHRLHIHGLRESNLVITLICILHHILTCLKSNI